MKGFFCTSLLVFFLAELVFGNPFHSQQSHSIKKRQNIIKDENKKGILPECHMQPSYPPPNDRILKEFVINLDINATQRWNEPILFYKNDIIKMINLVLNNSAMLKVSKALNHDINTYLSLFPKDWGNELIGISNLLNINITSLFVYNIAYELFGLCTSIVAQDNNYHIYHARNLDFGLWPSVNWTEVQWTLTDDLRNILFNVNFTKNNKLLYRSTVFGGYIGLLTGMKPGALSISVDTRFDDNYDKYFIKFLSDPNNYQQWLSLTTRLAMEDYNNYNDAINFIHSQNFIGPCYIIIGGISMNEGSVLTFGPNNTLYDKWSISNDSGLPLNNSYQKPFYVLETNYDHWNQPPWFDDRRYPAELCMDEIGSKGMDWYTLYNVLNAIPNRNRLTTYTTLMDTINGDYIAYKQYCDQPDCVPW